MSGPDARRGTGRCLAAFLLSLTLLASGARAEVFEDLDENYGLEIPDTWSRLPTDPAWKAHGIVFGATRTLERLRSGDPPAGEGGLVELAIATAAETKGLDDWAADPAVRSFLLGRFGEPEGWPAVDVLTHTYEGGLEVRLLSAEGKARNLNGTMAPARAVMILALAKGKLYRLRMVAFPTAFDEEGLRSDLDVIEGGFEIPDTTEAPKDDAPPPEPPADPADVIDGDEGEEVPVADLLVGWKLVKPIGIKSKADIDRSTYENTVAWYEDRDARGSYQVVFTVLRNDRRVNGVQAQAVDLQAWGLDPWWPEFHRQHEGGPVRTWPWSGKARALLELPEFEAERVLFETVADRPPAPGDVKGKQLLRKHRAVEKVPNRKLGAEKTREAYRGALGGSLAHRGREIQLRYVWKTNRLTCYLSVSIVGEGLATWGEGIAALLRSIEMTGRPRRR